MPRIKPEFKPGVNNDITALAAEGEWTDSDKVRFHNDVPQVIGGWQAPPLTIDPATITVFDSVVFDPDVFQITGLTTEIYPGQVRGAHAWSDLGGISCLAWGTEAGLFVMRNSVVYDITPTDFVPRTGESSLYGVGNYGADVYGGSPTIMWSLDNWGENLLSNPRLGTLYEWVPGTAKALPVANAPDIIEAMFVTPERMVVLLGTTEFGGVLFNPMLVRWCDQGDNTQWAPAPDNIAGEFPLANGTKLVSGIVTRSQNLIWSNTSLYTQQFTGDVNSVFVIRAVGHGCGIVGPHAKTSSDSAVFWVTRDNFYSFTGQVPIVLPCSVRKDLFENIYEGKEEIIHAGWNTGFSEPWFFYPDSRDGTGECSRYAMMSPKGAWAIGFFDRTAWVRAGIFPFPIAFSANHKIYYHEVPNAGDDGNQLDAFVESGFVDIGDGDTLYVVKRIVPDFEDQGPDVNITLKCRMEPNGAITSRGPFIATPSTRKLDMRVKGREMAIRLESSGIPGSSFWGLGAIALDAQPSGEKR